jgi:uncharacterized protein (TIGR02246 family)
MFKGSVRSLSSAAAMLVVAAALTRPLAAADVDLASVAARVQVLEDREAIRALILAYGQAHDHRDYRTFADLFASNGEWVGGLGSAKGPRAIFELMDKTIGHKPLPNGSGTYHVMTNDQIKLDGDRASATTKWIYLTPGTDNAPKLVYLGHYDDQFVREDGEWKFLRREAPADIPAAAPN